MFNVDAFEVRDHGMAGWGCYYEKRFILVINPANGDQAPAPRSDPSQWIQCYEQIVSNARRDGALLDSPQKRARFVSSFIQGCIASQDSQYAWHTVMQEARPAAMLKRACMGGLVYPVDVCEGAFIFVGLGGVPRAEAASLSDADFLKQSRAKASGAFGIHCNLRSGGDWMGRRVDSGKPVAFRDLRRHSNENFGALRSLSAEICAFTGGGDAWGRYIDDNSGLFKPISWSWV